MHLLANAGLKKPRWVYYLENLAAFSIPRKYYQRGLPRIVAKINPEQKNAVRDRINYYNRLRDSFLLDPSAQPMSLNILNSQRNYQMDLYRSVRRFPPHFRVNARFGDITDVPLVPTIVKARPIDGDHPNAILFNMNRIRHFVFVRDPTPFAQKQNKLVWRGNARQDLRQYFLEKYYHHPKCDVGHARKRRSPATEWSRPYLSITEQLQHKFILSIEGNDVATNLKWILSSNSLCFMPRPRMETWFMEGRLQAGRDYVQLRDDFSDLEEKMDFYERNTEAALAIIQNANRHAAQFMDTTVEEAIALLVLEKYFYLSGQA